MVFETYLASIFYTLLSLSILFLSRYNSVLYFTVFYLIVKFLLIYIFNNLPSSQDNFFYTDDQAHYLHGLNYIYASLNEYNLLNLLNFHEINNSSNVNGLPNGTSYMIIGGVFYYFFNNILSPHDTLILLNFIVIYLNIFILYIWMTDLKVDKKVVFIMIAIYLNLPMTNYYASLAMKDIYLSFLSTALLYSLWRFINNNNKFIFIIITLTFMIYLDRWYILFFIYIPLSIYYFFKLRGLLLKVLIVVSSTLFLFYIFQKVPWQMGTILNGYGHNQGGFFTHVPIYLKFLLSPLIALKFLISPNLVSLVNEKSGPASYFFAYLYSIQLVLPFYMILLFRKFINHKNIKLNYDMFKNSLGFIIFIVLFFFISFSTFYSSSHGRAREAFIPVLILVIGFLFPSKIKNIATNINIMIFIFISLIISYLIIKIWV